MKEAYRTLRAAARDIGIDPEVLRYGVLNGDIRSVSVTPSKKKGGQNSYFVITRKLCEELHKPFVPD